MPPVRRHRARIVPETVRATYERAFTSIADYREHNKDIIVSDDLTGEPTAPFRLFDAGLLSDEPFTPAQSTRLQIEQAVGLWQRTYRRHRDLDDFRAHIAACGALVQKFHDEYDCDDGVIEWWALALRTSLVHAKRAELEVFLSDDFYAASFLRNPLRVSSATPPRPVPLPAECAPPASCDSALLEGSPTAC